MRPAFTVLRIQKLKTWGAIGGSGKHNQRERETPNADAARTAENRTVVGSADSDSVAQVKEAIGTQRIRKNAVLGVEMLLSASPEYFRKLKRPVSMMLTGSILGWTPLHNGCKSVTATG